MIRFIGVYDYTVILTYASLISSIFGMTQAIHGDYKTAILCLAFSGILDAFDGRVARTKKNRTDDEKAFGIQLDSLCDVICFGVFPALICYLLGVRGTLGLPIVFFYCICQLHRLLLFQSFVVGIKSRFPFSLNKFLICVRICAARMMKKILLKIINWMILPIIYVNISSKILK